jgi:hypothetical protein
VQDSFVHITDYTKCYSAAVAVCGVLPQLFNLSPLDTLQAIEFCASFLRPFDVFRVSNRQDRLVQLVLRNWGEIVPWLMKCTKAYANLLSSCRSEDASFERSVVESQDQFFETLESFVAGLGRSLLTSNSPRATDSVKLLAASSLSQELLVSIWEWSSRDPSIRTTTLTRLITKDLTTFPPQYDPILRAAILQMFKGLYSRPDLVALHTLIAFLQSLHVELKTLFLDYMPTLCQLLRRHISLPKRSLPRNYAALLISPLQFMRFIISIDGAVAVAQTNGNLIPFLWALVKLDIKGELDEWTRDECMELIKDLTELTTHYSVLRHLYRSMSRYSPMTETEGTEANVSRVWLQWNVLCEVFALRMEERWKFMNSSRRICDQKVR